MGTGRKKPFKLWGLHFQPVHEDERCRIFESEHVRLLNSFFEGSTWRAELLQSDLGIRGLRWGSPARAMACLFSALDCGLIACQNVLDNRPQEFTEFVVQTLDTYDEFHPLCGTLTDDKYVVSKTSLIEYTEAEKNEWHKRLLKLQAVHALLKPHDFRTPYQLKFA